jgi:hypothetical protein
MVAENALDLELVRSVAGTFRVPPREAASIIDRVGRAVGTWPRVASALGISRGDRDAMADAFLANEEGCSVSTRRKGSRKSTPNESLTMDLVRRWLHRTPTAVVVALLALGAPVADAQDADLTAQSIAGGAWHFASIPCADGLVSAVSPRLTSSTQTGFSPEDFQQSGVSVTIRFSQPWKYLARLTTTKETIVHYEGMAGNALMQSERAGDRVQVCLTGFPLPRIDPATKHVLCDPDQDPRGFEFRVYDVRRHAAYIGPNAEHACGGA